MLPESYRRLWRRRLRRRPLLPFLLAAVFAVDAVIALQGLETSELGSGFLAAQISLLAIWITHTSRGLLLRTVIAFIVSVLVGVGTAYSPSDTFYGPQELFAIFAAVVSLLVSTSSATAAIVRTASRRLRPAKLQAKRRVTIAGILTLTFFVAILLATFREARLSVITDPLVVGLIVAGVLPTLWITAVFAFTTRGWPRTVLAVAIPLAVTLPLLVTGAGKELSVFLSQTFFTGAGVTLLDWRREPGEPKQSADSGIRAHYEPTTETGIDITA